MDKIVRPVQGKAGSGAKNPASGLALFESLTQTLTQEVRTLCSENQRLTSENFRLRNEVELLRKARRDIVAQIDKMPVAQPHRPVVKWKHDKKP